MRRVLLCWFVVLTGCSADGCEARPAARLPAPPAAAAPSEDVSDPEAVVEDLAALSPATTVALSRSGLTVDNEALLASWPPDALARAQSAGGAEGWPRVRAEMAFPSDETGELPALRAALSRTREAERSATGAGQGAGTYNLRVANDVPFRALQRVLFTSAMAGYGPPRVVLASSEGLRLLPWPASLPRNAPTPEQIAALLRGTPLPEDPNAAPPPERPAQVVLRPDGALLVQLAEETQTAGCEVASTEPDPVTLLPSASPASIGRCLDVLHPRSDEDAITLSIGADVPFARLSPVLQHATRVFDQVRIRRR